MMALSGIVVRYHTLVRNHHGKNVMILPDAFAPTLKARASVRLLLDHEPEHFVGSTTDGTLELESNRECLLFRARLPDTEMGRTARDMAVNEKCDGVSVGFDSDGALKETRTINGLDVVCIVKATILEVSYLHAYSNPAMRAAFAIYRDVDFSKSLRDEYSTARAFNDGAGLGFRRALQKLLDA